MTSSKRWVRLELALLWIVFSAVAGILLGRHFAPYEPGGPQFHRGSTLDAMAGGQP